VTPLSPGRACLAGAGEGRAWLATATFDPATGRARVRVLHQAAEPPDPDAKDFWRRPGVVFNPLWMRTLTAWRGADPGGDEAGGPEAGAAEAGEVRVLVFRNSSDPAIANHLLVADPDAGTVSVLEDETIAWTGEAVAARGAGAYCAWYPAAGDAEAGTGPCLWRVGLPDLRRRCVARGIIPLRPGEQGPQRFSVAFARGRVYLFGDQLWVAPKPEGPFRRVSGTPPEYNVVGEPALRDSAHYGLVLTVWDKVYGARFGSAAR
jgi:hypothetical protein